MIKPTLGTWIMTRRPNGSPVIPDIHAILRFFGKKNPKGYADERSTDLVYAYRRACEEAGINLYIAMAHAYVETEGFDSALAAPYNNGVGLNNFANIGITGKPSNTPAPGHVYVAHIDRYVKAAHFDDIETGARAHVGLLAAYALGPNAERNGNQQAMIAEALRIVDVPKYLQGAAYTIESLGAAWNRTDMIDPSFVWTSLSGAPYIGKQIAEIAAQMMEA